ncbi:MAG: TolC family protein, partial [Pelistega sp.]|nr:TolC family protein [Pelistega sp.]
MASIFRLSVISSTVLLAACNFAPKYETPESPVAAEYKVNSASTATTAADLGWQSFFNDNRLKKIIELGLANNRDLLMATKNVEIAQKQYGIQLSNIFPKFGLSASQSAQNLPADMSRTGVRDISRTYIAGLGVSNFEIDFFGKIRNQNEAALQTYFATEQAQRTAQINLVASLANTYFTIRTLEEMEKLVSETLGAYERTYQMTHARFKAGVASMLDVNQAKSTYDGAKAALAETRRNKEQAVNALELLMGQPLPADLPKAPKFGADV